MRRFLTLGIVALLIQTTACNDVEDLPKPQTDSTTTTEHVITANWKITSHTLEPVTSLQGEWNEVKDVYATYDECARNSILTFNVGGTYIIEANEAFCGPDRTESENGVWRYNSEKTSIILNEGDEGQLLVIEELNERTLRIRSTKQMDGRNYYDRLTYSRQ